MHVLPKSRRAAWWQGIALVAGALALGIALVLPSRRPFDVDTLAIPVDTLRSQAAEANLLEAQVRRDDVTPAFARLHAEQLREQVDRTRDALDAKPATTALEPRRRDGLALADAVRARLDTLARDGAAPRHATLGFGAAARALDALGHRIKPED